MTPKEQADFDRGTLDLEWWEAAFGKGNVVGWTFKRSASVDWAGRRRSVDTLLRNWIIDNCPRQTLALAKMAKETDMSPMHIIAVALRLYQEHLNRLKSGETCTWSGDRVRTALSEHNPFKKKGRMT